MLKTDTKTNKEALPDASGEQWPMASAEAVPPPELPAGQTWPKISIVTPSFNQGDYLEKTIRSVLLQGYPNLEYSIIDGGSTDQSIDIIKKYESWIDYWVSEKDPGQSHAINKGLENATGELLGWLNSDDYFLPGALFKFAQTYLEDTSVGAIYGHGHIADQSGNVIHKARTAEVNLDNLFDWFDGGAEFMQPSCLFTKHAWRKCGPLAEDLHYSMDIDLWIKIAKQFNFKMVDELLSISLRHDDAKTYAEAEYSYLDLAMVYTRHDREDKAREVLEKQTVKLINYQKEYETCRIHNEELKRKVENLTKLPLLGKMVNKYLR